MNKTKTFNCVMLFFSEYEMDLSDRRDKFVYHKTIYFSNSFDALEYYANTRCPASQLIQASSEEDLNQKEKEMKDNFKDKDFVNKLMERL